MRTGKIRIVDLDKTGTITRGEPKVTDIIPLEGISGKEPLADEVLIKAVNEQGYRVKNIVL